ncbi:cation transporter [Flavobacterium faecale]|uniref:cation transporter n=1 Tax=Flavobacterium faecale TaxID=1355330 RepID=UPI003AACD70A
MEVQKLYKMALNIAIFVMVYNILESILAVHFGYEEESLTLFGFGFDSAVEVASNLGVIYMIKRIQQNPKSNRTQYEKTALKITGYGFYILSVILFIGVIISLMENRLPMNTLFGVIISIISIVIMLFVVTKQMQIGNKLNSKPIIADAKCTLVCVYMSVVLLISSALYYFFGFQYADVLGALGLVYFSIKEGRECFENVKNNSHCSC